MVTIDLFSEGKLGMEEKTFTIYFMVLIVKKVFKINNKFILTLLMSKQIKNNKFAAEKINSKKSN